MAVLTIRNIAAMLICAGLLYIVARPLLLPIFSGQSGNISRSAMPSAKQAEGTMRVNFISAIDPAGGVSFTPDKPYIDVRIGENAIIFYRASTSADKTVHGKSYFEISPKEAAKYFTTVECYCAGRQAIDPGREQELPMSFFIDSAILDDMQAKGVKELTLTHFFLRDGKTP